MRVESLVNARGNAVPNQFIIRTRDKLVFQSYDSIICEYDKKSKILFVFENWDYSVTTMKHFKHFVNEHTAHEYESAKQWRKLLNSEDSSVIQIELPADYKIEG